MMIESEESSAFIEQAMVKTITVHLVSETKYTSSIIIFICTHFLDENIYCNILTDELVCTVFQ